ncbi:hypothetical protein ACF9IK_21180 [Kitasatospora hibisci]
MQVAPRTVHQALCVQGRGGLRRELAGALRTGRARRVPHRPANCRRPGLIGPMTVIGERPADL